MTGHCARNNKYNTFVTEPQTQPVHDLRTYIPHVENIGAGISWTATTNSRSRFHEVGAGGRRSAQQASDEEPRRRLDASICRRPK